MASIKCGPGHHSTLSTTPCGPRPLSPLLLPPSLLRMVPSPSVVNFLLGVRSPPFSTKAHYYHYYYRVTICVWTPLTLLRGRGGVEPPSLPTEPPLLHPANTRRRCSTLSRDHRAPNGPINTFYTLTGATSRAPNSRNVTKTTKRDTSGSKGGGGRQEFVVRVDARAMAGAATAMTVVGESSGDCSCCCCWWNGGGGREEGGGGWWRWWRDWRSPSLSFNAPLYRAHFALPLPL